jgi:hypothetical protein
MTAVDALFWSLEPEGRSEASQDTGPSDLAIVAQHAARE